MIVNTRKLALRRTRDISESVNKIVRAVAWNKKLSDAFKDLVTFTADCKKKNNCLAQYNMDVFFDPYLYALYVTYEVRGRKCISWAYTTKPGSKKSVYMERSQDYYYVWGP